MPLRRFDLLQPSQQCFRGAAGHHQVRTVHDPVAQGDGPRQQAPHLGAQPVRSPSQRAARAVDSESRAVGRLRPGDAPPQAALGPREGVPHRHRASALVPSDEAGHLRRQSGTASSKVVGRLLRRDGKGAWDMDRLGLSGVREITDL